MTLNDYIEASGYKLKFIAEKLGITYQSLYNKLHDISKFTLVEALRLKHLLNITEDDWNNIFGNETVPTSD